MNFNHAVDLIYDYGCLTLCVQRRRDLTQIFLSGLDRSYIGDAVIEAISSVNSIKYDWQPMPIYEDFYKPKMGFVVVYKSHGEYHIVMPAHEWGVAPAIVISQKCKRDDLGEAIITQINYPYVHGLL